MKRFVPVFVLAAAVAAGAYVYSQSQRPAILGAWEVVPTPAQTSTMGVTTAGPKSLIVLSDGTLSYDGRGLKYRIVDGNNLVITYDKDTQEVLPFRVEDDHLTLWIAGEDINYRRHYDGGSGASIAMR